MNEYELEEEYLRYILQLQNFQEEGFFGVYGLESMRVHAHEKLCDKYGVDYQDAKAITLYLDKVIGLPIGNFDIDECEKLEKRYAPRLAEAFKRLNQT